MAGIFGLFKGFTSGKKPTPNGSSSSHGQTPTHTEAIASIRDTVEILQKKEQEIERRIDEEHNKAKAYVTKNKNSKSNTLNYSISCANCIEKEESLGDPTCKHSGQYHANGRTGTATGNSCY